MKIITILVKIIRREHRNCYIPDLSFSSVRVTRKSGEGKSLRENPRIARRALRGEIAEKTRRERPVESPVFTVRDELDAMIEELNRLCGFNVSEREYYAGRGE